MSVPSSSSTALFFVVSICTLNDVCAFAIHLIFCLLVYPLQRDEGISLAAC